MAVDVLTEITISRPAEVVAAYAADPSNAPAWYENITSVRWENEPPLRTGSRVAFTARFLGRQLAYTYEVTEFIPAERLVMRTSQGPFPMETTYVWRDTSEGWTQMTVRSRGAPGGLARLALPLIGIATRVADRNDLARLKTILEQGVRVQRQEGGSEAVAAA